MHDTVVLIPYFKRQDALLKTLDSFQGEAPGFDVLIVDDGSPIPLTIDTAAFNFPIKIIHMPENRGIEHALNVGLEDILSGSYVFVARLDAGDFWRPGRLEAQRNFLLAHPDHGIVGSSIAIQRQDGTIFDLDMPQEDEDIRRFIYFNSPFIHPAIMMRADVIRQAGFYSDRFEAAEDYEYYHRILKCAKGANLPGKYVICETGQPGTSISVDKARQQIKSVIKVQIKYFNPLEWRAYAGLLYKILHLHAPGIANFLKKRFRRLAI